MDAQMDRYVEGFMLLMAMTLLGVVADHCGVPLAL